MALKDGQVIPLEEAGFQIRIKVITRFDFNDERLEAYLTDEEGEELAYVTLSSPEGTDWGQWQDARIGSSSIGNAARRGSGNVVIAEGEFLRFIGRWMIEQDEAVAENKEHFLEEAKAKREREAEEERERLAALEAQWEEREERIKWELIGEQVRVREAHIKHPRRATLSLLESGRIWINYASDRDYNLTHSIRQVVMLEVKRGSRYEKIWEDERY